MGWRECDSVWGGGGVMVCLRSRGLRRVMVVGRKEGV